LSATPGGFKLPNDGNRILNFVPSGIPCLKPAPFEGERACKQVAGGALQAADGAVTRAKTPVSLSPLVRNKAVGGPMHVSWNPLFSRRQQAGTGKGQGQATGRDRQWGGKGKRKAQGQGHRIVSHRQGVRARAWAGNGLWAKGGPAGVCE